MNPQLRSIERKLQCTPEWKTYLGMKTLPHWPYPRLVAHRGAGKLAPENTLAAFRQGAAYGYQAFAFDVKLSADGKCILIHDALLDRTADALTLSELAQLDAGSWHSPSFAGEPVATLVNVARYTRANNFAVHVEIKPSPGREWRTGVAVAIDVQNLWRHAEITPLLSSFSEEALSAAREFVPDLPRALLLDALPDDWLLRLEALGCTALNAHHMTLSREIIAQAHTAGYRVLCYAVNDPKRARQLLDWGIDSMITEAVNILPPFDRSGIASQ